jgi:hypothetical protein
VSCFNPGSLGRMRDAEKVARRRVCRLINPGSIGGVIAAGKNQGGGL